MKEKIYYVKGTHCASCELIIERELLKMESIKSVDVSSSKGEVVIAYQEKVPHIGKLNKIFKSNGYTFTEKKEAVNETGESNFFVSFGVAVLIIAGFFGLSRLGVGNIVNVSDSSSLPSFFIFGVLAGLSSCAALVGGLILSMAKQWGEIYSKSDKFTERAKPHIMFNAGRLASYALLGGVLGEIGNRLELSLNFMSFLTFAVSALMIVLALQMMGVKSFQRFQLRPPKFITRYVSNEKNFQGKYMPFLMGAGTFFLPCGFTITAQSLALLSGSFLSGGAIMLFFALGTLPVLAVIGLSSVKLVNNHNLSNQFLRVAGILVLFFALFNINNQLNVLGVGSLNDLSLNGLVSGETNATCGGIACDVDNNNNAGGGASQSDNDLPPIVEGKQIIKMTANSRGYSPNYFKVRVGVPVKWEITDQGTSGCTNAVISKSLFDGQISLTPGETSVKEFMPTTQGKFKFSCWMGMVSGIIEVVN